MLVMMVVLLQQSGSQLLSSTHAASSHAQPCIYQLCARGSGRVSGPVLAYAPFFCARVVTCAINQWHTRDN